MENLNYEGIKSINLDKINATQVAPSVYEYILWEYEKNIFSVIYKFGKNSKFPIDPHKTYDEHIYVLSGTFNDGRSDYKEGSYIFNPKGTVHIPQSKEGCTVLVTFMYK